MPLYDYHCPKCDKETAEIIAMEDYSSETTVTCHTKDCGNKLDKNNRMIGGATTKISGFKKGDSVRYSF